MEECEEGEEGEEGGIGGMIRRAWLLLAGLWALLLLGVNLRERAPQWGLVLPLAVLPFAVPYLCRKGFDYVIFGGRPAVRRFRR